MPVIGDVVGLTLDRILLATDFSATAEAATEYAIALAKRFSATLMLTHVVDLSLATRSGAALAGMPIDELRHEAGTNLMHLANRLAVEGIRSTSHTMEDSNPAAAIVRLAKRMNADLIVTGTSARQGLSKMILGSCAEGVIRHAQCPAVTIGPQTKPLGGEALSFHNIVFATDFNTDAVQEAAVACAFARDSMAKLYLCHIIDDEASTPADQMEIQDRAAEALASLVPDASYEWVNPQFVVEHGKTAEEILGLANGVSADLIVLGARRIYGLAPGERRAGHDPVQGKLSGDDGAIEHGGGTQGYGSRLTVAVRRAGGASGSGGQSAAPLRFRERGRGDWERRWTCRG